MKKEKLIDDIINTLYESDCIDIQNFCSRSDAFAECASIIEGILDDYIIIRGDILE